MSHELVERNDEIYKMIKRKVPTIAIMDEYGFKSSKSVWAIKDRYEKRIAARRNTKSR